MRILLLSLFGLTALAQTTPPGIRDLCPLLPSGGAGLPDAVQPMIRDAFTQVHAPPPGGPACGFCSRGIKQKVVQGLRYQELVVAIYLWPTREGAQWGALTFGKYKPNSNEFGDGGAHVLRYNGEFHFGFTVGNFHVFMQGQSTSEAKAVEIARSLRNSLARETMTCNGGTGDCNPAAIQAAELTNPQKSTIESESANFSWNSGKYIRAYHLKVDTKPGGADLGNFGPAKNTSAGVRMPAKETAVYVTLISYPECGGGPALPKTYVFQYPGPPSVK